MINDLKGYQWWQEEIMLQRENQMIDHKNMAITRISLADEVKHSS